MTTMMAPPTIAGETSERDAIIRDAVLAYFMELATFVDMQRARLLHEDPEFDIEVSVPHEQLYSVTEHLADLTFRVSEKYNVKILALAVPT